MTFVLIELTIFRGIQEQKKKKTLMDVMMENVPEVKKNT
jgi:hypothetical protein